MTDTLSIARLLTHEARAFFLAPIPRVPAHVTPLPAPVYAPSAEDVAACKRGETHGKTNAWENTIEISPSDFIDKHTGAEEKTNGFYSVRACNCQAAPMFTSPTRLECIPCNRYCETNSAWKSVCHWNTHESSNPTMFSIAEPTVEESVPKPWWPCEVDGDDGAKPCSKCGKFPIAIEESTLTCSHDPYQSFQAPEHTMTATIALWNECQARRTARYSKATSTDFA